MKMILIILAAFAGLLISSFAILAFALTAIHHMNKYMKDTEDKYNGK